MSGHVCLHHIRTSGLEQLNGLEYDASIVLFATRIQSDAEQRSQAVAENLDVVHLNGACDA